MTWTAANQDLIERAQHYFVGHTAAIGVLLVSGETPMFIKSGVHGGPWGGTQRGHVPRLPGWSFTQGGASQGNIGTHVEGHAAAIMWQRQFSLAILLVDRPMCSICSAFLSAAIPPGSRLTVVSQDEGVTHVWSSHHR